MATAPILPDKPRRGPGRRHPFNPWSPSTKQNQRSSIAVIEPAEPRPDPPEGARVVPFGFARALVDIESEPADGWAEHAAAMVAG